MPTLQVIHYLHGGYSLPQVFSVEDAAELREKHGIYGILSGTLPLNAQQNSFLYLPLTLSLEEAFFLVKNGHANLSVVESATNAAVIALKNQDLQSPVEGNYVLTPDQFGVRPETPKDTALRWLLHNAGQVQLSYPLYEKLRSVGITVLPGARFGCKYVGYPGDPLRYHSQHLVTEPLRYTDDTVNLLQLVNLTRLGTIVKKSVIVSGVLEAPTKLEQPHKQKQKQKFDTVKVFTIEWCGFG
ncbi:hypothetical protein TPHA_0F00810 [Tetrapisispora phaffii CBS 4417]|uniref:tRNA-splicing endonuclease subunit Sen34 n=1 Tax=Tetrapisispora phaffii (strain ATCC 24235 / CBS 4417 / NBRC 1672 / NRRL Y-8282 / UCD 70-5) TaxID=1071381 RepID=G8BUY5_TETPH|nr:hypothetical protein TPHA_0F00810 [Tetrapisispora phaffii CBS 4417]CCE63567.1 hypothetical protein TPHA_0F00810 [Tetrapisispora phaffii CBS 4417]